MSEVRAKSNKVPGWRPSQYPSSPAGVYRHDLERFDREEAVMIDAKLFIDRYRPATQRQASDDHCKRFDTYLRAWKDETSHFSLVRQHVDNINFLKIIALGEDALPLIFAEFRKLPILAWFKALEAITGADPAQKATSHREAVELWLAWACDNGYTQR